MTETPEIHFRCPTDLRDAIDAAATQQGKRRTEIIVRALCRAFKIKYVAPKPGRPPKGKQ